MAEKGFFHPEYGYWQTISTPSPEIIASYPEGTIEVPLKPGADYEWDGEEWQHVPPPEPTPEERRATMAPITARQLRLTLLRAGHPPATVEAAIQAIPDAQEREEALIEWEYASHYVRLHPLILSLAPALELTPEQVDALWGQASEA